MTEQIVYVSAAGKEPSSYYMTWDAQCQYTQVKKNPSPEMQRKCRSSAERKRSGPIWSPMYDSMDELASAVTHNHKRTSPLSRNDVGHAAEASEENDERGTYQHLSPRYDSCGAKNSADFTGDEYEHIYDRLDQDSTSPRQRQRNTTSTLSKTPNSGKPHTVYVPGTPPQGRRTQSDALPPVPSPVCQRTPQCTKYRPLTPDLSGHRTQQRIAIQSTTNVPIDKRKRQSPVSKPNAISGGALREQCWFHGNISRPEAEIRLCEMVHEFETRKQNWDGVYLVRERVHDEQYVVSVARNIQLDDGTKKVQCEHHMIARDPAPNAGVILNGVGHYSGLKTVVSVVRALGRVRTMCMTVTKRDEMLCKMPCLRK